MRIDSFWPALIGAVLLAGNCQAWAQQVGTVSSYRPQAEQTPPQAPKTLVALDTPILRDAMLETAANGLLEVTFLDNSKLAMGGSSAILVDEMTYAGPASPAGQVLKLTKGVFRFISGSVPKENVKIETPSATIGIRGTKLRVRVEPDGTTTAGCDEGVVTIVSRLTGQSLTLNPGEKVTIKPGGEMGPVTLGQVEGCPG